MSEITARPPLLRTRKISSKSCRFAFGSTRLRTQFETTTSTESLATSGCLTRNSCATSSARRNEAASVIGRAFSSSSSFSRSRARSWMRPLRNSTFEKPIRSATIGALRRATSSISSVISTPMTLPCGPTTCAAMKQIFPGPAAEIEHGLALAQILARIATTVIALDHFLRNRGEILRFVFDRTTKFVRAYFRSGRITLTDDGFRALAHLGEALTGESIPEKPGMRLSLFCLMRPAHRRIAAGAQALRPWAIAMRVVFETAEQIIYRP